MRSTLVTDGASDKVLVPILGWLLGQHTTAPVELQWADLPRASLRERVQAAVALYPCEDFSPLRRLPAFQALEAELEEILAQLLPSGKQ